MHKMVLEAYKEAAAAICPQCRRGNPVYGGSGWFHEVDRGFSVVCSAAAIHDLIAHHTQQPTGKVNKHARRVAIYRFIIEFDRTYNLSPSYREIMAATGIPSTSVVRYHLNEMVKMGLIYYAPTYTRALRLVRPLRHDYAGDLMEPESPLQPCGHPLWAVSSADEGTAHCWVCELVERVGQVEVNRLAEFYCDGWRGRA